MKQVKALDQLHISSVRSGMITAGDTFDIGDAEAKSLADRGLVKVLGDAKAAPEPENKKAAEPANKAAPISARGVKAAR